MCELGLWKRLLKKFKKLQTNYKKLQTIKPFKLLKSNRTNWIVKKTWTWTDLNPSNR